MAIVIIFLVMFLLMFLGMPVLCLWQSLGYAICWEQGNGPLSMISNSMVNGLSDISLMAIPFFILVGELMNISGMTERMLDFSMYFIGKFRGGLAHACIVVNVIFHWFLVRARQMRQQFLLFCCPE